MDVSSLVTPLDDENPSGEDLEYDPVFGEMTRAAEGTKAQTIGDHVKEGEPPDWKKVRELGLELFERTRDLRVGVLLTTAGLHLDGYSGLRDGLNLLLKLSQDQWETVHPQLDEDDGDPFIRCNALRELNNRVGLLEEVLDAPLVESRRAGRFGLRSVKVVKGELSHKGEEPAPTGQLIDAAFQDVETDEVLAVQGLLEECTTTLDEMNQFYQTQVGAMDAPNLGPATDEQPTLHDFLKEAAELVQKEVVKLGLGEAPEGEDGDDGASDNGGGGGAVGGAAAISGSVQSREDVVRVLDSICDYYAAQEPSSPVPILLRRASALVYKSFEEIINDLAPGGLAEVQTFVGTESAGSNDGWGSSSGDDGWGSSSSDDSESESSDDGW